MKKYFLIIICFLLFNCCTEESIQSFKNYNREKTIDSMEIVFKTEGDSIPRKHAIEFADIYESIMLQYSDTISHLDEIIDVDTVYNDQIIKDTIK